jgi:LmbE family N-acetylglucosaminyl deacetylase
MDPIRVIVFGAHPDDCEYVVGGTAARWSALGHRVQFVSCTNGDVGHHTQAGGALARRRLAEVRKAARTLGVETRVLDIHDGELLPTLENRKTVVRLIREWKADVVISHRPNDYHPDHRYTGVLVQDAAYMVTVPFYVPDTPHLAGNPVFLYTEDPFQKPTPFRADIVVAIDGVVEKKLGAFDVMESQFLEGGCNAAPESLPKDAAGWEVRRRKVREELRSHFAARADRFRPELVKAYGKEKGRKVRYAEAFEICEYGRRPDAAEIRRLFPFYPAR